MSFLKENPFVAGVAVVTGLAVAGLLYYGTTQSAAYEENLEAYGQAETKAQQQNRLALFPTNANADKKEEAISAFRSDVQKAQEALASFIPQDLQDVAPSEFSARVQSAADEVAALAAQENLTLPEGFALGFEKELSTPPQQSATGELSFQLGGIKWLVEKMVEANVAELRSLNRSQTVAEGAASPGANVAEPMVIDLVFSGREPAVRQLLSEMVSSDQYFFRIKYARVQNSANRAPSRKRIDFDEEVEEEEGDTEAAPSFLVEEAPAADDADDPPAADAGAAAGERIVTQILGNEQVVVGARIELMLFPKN